MSADGPTINIYSEQRVARLPSPFFLTFFLNCVHSLTIKVWLMVTGVKSIVRSDLKIFTADRSDSECRRSRRLDPPSVPPTVPRSAIVQTDRTPFLTFYQTQVLALACLVIHHSMGLLCLWQCLICTTNCTTNRTTNCRPQRSGFSIFDFH